MISKRNALYHYKSVGISCKKPNLNKEYFLTFRRRLLLGPRNARLDRRGEQLVDAKRLRDRHGQPRGLFGLAGQRRDVLADVPAAGEEVGGEDDAGGAEGGRLGDGVADRRAV